MKICIITPTYNRVKLLERLYDSLEKQNVKNFTWLLIDDGSTDDTAEYLEKISTTATFNIIYEMIENNGKSKALNYGFKKYKKAFDFFLIVDSDDYLIKTGMHIVTDKVNLNKNENEIGALFFRYNFLNNGEINSKISFNYEANPYVSSRINHDIKFLKYDGSIGYFSKVFDKNLFPEYPNEKYIGPTVLQILIDKDYNIAFYNDTIGVAEYQSKGLTASGRKLRLNSPLGMIHYSGLYQNAGFINNIKYSITAQAYKIHSKINRSKVAENGLSKYIKLWALLPGYILSKIWSKDCEN